MFSYCSNCQNCVGIVLKLSACNVLFESDRITLIARGPDYLRALYISCGSEPFYQSDFLQPIAFKRVENCVRVHTVSNAGTFRINSLDFILG